MPEIAYGDIEVGMTVTLKKKFLCTVTSVEKMKAKKGGFKKGQRVQATYDKGDPKWYGAKVVGVHWSDSLETLIGVDLKYDDGAFWNNAPVYAIKCLA